MTRVYLMLVASFAALVVALWLLFDEAGLVAGLLVVSVASLTAASGEAKRVRDGSA